MNSAAGILSGKVIESEFVLQDVKVDCNIKWAILRPQDQEDKNTLHLYLLCRFISHQICQTLLLTKNYTNFCSFTSFLSTAFLKCNISKNPIQISGTISCEISQKFTTFVPPHHGSTCAKIRPIIPQSSINSKGTAQAWKDKWHWEVVITRKLEQNLGTSMSKVLIPNSLLSNLKTQREHSFVSLYFCIFSSFLYMFFSYPLSHGHGDHADRSELVSCWLSGPTEMCKLFSDWANDSLWWRFSFWTPNSQNLL